MTSVEDMSTIGEGKYDEPSAEDKDKGVAPIESTSNIQPPVPPKDWRFWSIIASLGITAVLAAIDGTIITTALPSIAAALSGGEKYVWVVGAYFLSR